MPTSSTFKSFGQPDDVIELTEVAHIDLSPGEVRLRMHSAPINPADINYIQGIYGIKPELPVTPGLEGCGEVVESLSEDLQAGDLVIALQAIGTWREEVVCHASDVLQIPKETPIDQASMLKVNPLTAWCMLTQFIDLPKGAWVIQNAANSGVGTCVIQIAKLLGLRTINLVRRDDVISELIDLGGDHVLLDNQESLDEIKSITGEAPPALALNAVGGDSALRLMDALAPQGQHITYGAMSKRSLKVPNKFLIFKRIQLHGFWVTEWIKENDDSLVQSTYQKLAQWMIDEKLTQPIDSHYTLDKIHSAIDRANQDKREGKVIISMNN